MNTRELTCIGCPLGCSLTVSLNTDADGSVEVISVTGNTCPKGDIYARNRLFKNTSK